VERDKKSLKHVRRGKSVYRERKLRKKPGGPSLKKWKGRLSNRPKSRTPRRGNGPENWGEVGKRVGGFHSPGRSCSKWMQSFQGQERFRHAEIKEKKFGRVKTSDQGTRWENQGNPLAILGKGSRAEGQQRIQGNDRFINGDLWRESKKHLWKKGTVEMRRGNYVNWTESENKRTRASRRMDGVEGQVTACTQFSGPRLAKGSQKDIAKKTQGGVLGKIK